VSTRGGVAVRARARPRPRPRAIAFSRSNSKPVIDARAPIIKRVAGRSTKEQTPRDAYWFQAGAIVRVRTKEQATSGSVRPRKATRALAFSRHKAQAGQWARINAH